MPKLFNIDTFLEGADILENLKSEYTITIKDNIRYIDKENIIVVTKVLKNVNKNTVFTFKKVEKILDHFGLYKTDLAREMGTDRRNIDQIKNQTNTTLNTMIEIRNALNRLIEKQSNGKFHLSMTLEELFIDDDD